MVLNVDKKKWVTLAKDFGSLEFDAYGQLCLYQITIYQYSCIEIALKYETSWCQVVPSGTKVLSMYFPSGAKWSSFTFPCGHKIFWVSASAFDIAAVAGMPVYIMLLLRTFVIWKGMLVCCWIRSRSGGVFDLKRGSDVSRVTDQPKLRTDNVAFHPKCTNLLGQGQVGPFFETPKTLI